MAVPVLPLVLLGGLLLAMKKGTPAAAVASGPATIPIQPIALMAGASFPANVYRGPFELVPPAGAQGLAANITTTMGMSGTAPVVPSPQAPMNPGALQYVGVAPGSVTFAYSWMMNGQMQQGTLSLTVL